MPANKQTTLKTAGTSIVALDPEIVVQCNQSQPSFLTNKTFMLSNTNKSVPRLLVHIYQSHHKGIYDRSPMDTAAKLHPL